MSRLVIAVATAALLLAWANSATAGQRRWFQPQPPRNPRTLTPADRAAIAAYPKFTGGFHYHDLHNVGIPNGDIGLRGNGISMSPW